MANDVINEITDETRNKLRDFDEQEAYFLLCEIFSQAQATKDYAKFQSDLSEWKKRFPIDLFSEEYRRKIKYMLSKEFLDTVLKNFTAFDELSKKDPSKGLEKLRKILDKAEKHKDAKQLDKDLDALYSEYPLKYLKEKYPHLIGQLLSKSNRTRILQKFDSDLAFKELNTITGNPQNYEDADTFKSTIEEWQKLYPTADFNDKYRPQVEKLLTEALDTRKLEELFPISTELDLSYGKVVPLELKDSVKNINKVSKDALHDFFKIVDKNKGDVDSLFKWICKYNRYINGFDSTVKSAIVDNLMTKYAYELPPVNTKYQIPKMASREQDLLSLSEFNSIGDTKKQVLLQLLGILSTGRELTHEDSYRIAVIDSNVKKVEVIQKAKIEPKLDLFMEKFPEDKLTETDNVYINSNSDTRVDVSIDNDIDLTIHEAENDTLVVEEETVHTSEDSSFKDSLKIEETLEKVNSTSGTTGSSDSGNNSGGGSVSISSSEIESTKKDIETLDKDEKTEKEETPVIPQNTVPTTQDISPEEPTIKAVILESEPEIVEIEEKEPETVNTVSKASANTCIDTTSVEEIATQENSQIEENIIQENSQKEEPAYKNPVQNFFSKFIKHDRQVEDDGRDER